MDSQILYFFQSNVLDPILIKKIQVLASQYAQEYTELTKEVDIQLSKLMSFLTANLDNIHMEDEEIVSPLINMEPKVKRLYIDGCFDLMHSGHFNAIRQAKQLCDTLVVGVISSEAISKAKGQPIMTDQERISLVSACKWVDEVVEGVEYDPTIELLDKLNCSHVAHGDDLVQTSDGQDAYDPFKKAGRMKIFKRTEGISTTDIVGRLLLMTKETMWEEKKVFRKMSDQGNGEGIQASNLALVQQQTQQTEKDAMALLEDSLTNSKILNTTRRIRQFSNNKKPLPTDKIIYIDGSFDILHPGHIQVLQQARELGDFLFVGVYDNETINNIKGKNFPILNLQERVLNLLSLKYVDEVIIGVPYKVSDTMIKNFKISLVVEGAANLNKEELGDQSNEDAYAVPKKLGIFKILNSDIKLTADQLAERIVQNRIKYLQKFSTKKRKDLLFQEAHDFKVEEI